MRSPEPILSEVRERRDELIDRLHAVDKKDTKARTTLAEEIDTLGAVADVLAGALYVLKIDKKDAYYLQRVPEKLADLLRGAGRLGLDAELDGIVLKSDVEAFSARVTADRAVFQARRSVVGLSEAIALAVHAAWKPEEAAASEKAIGQEDARALRATLIETARAVAGELDRPPADVQLLASLRAMLNAQLAGIKGHGEQWLARFAEAISMADLVEQVGALDLPDGQAEALSKKAAAVEAALAGDDIGQLETAVLAFYGPITELAFGHPLESIDALAHLNRDRIDAMIAASAADLDAHDDAERIAAAKDDPAVQRLLALSDLMEASLSLNQSLERRASLPRVKARLEAVKSAAEPIPGGERIASEIDFWCDWLEPFLALEPLAKRQSEARSQIARDGLSSLARLWRSARPEARRLGDLDEEATVSPKSAFEALEKRDDPAAQGAMQLVGPIFEIAARTRDARERAEPEGRAAPLSSHRAASGAG